MPGAAHPGTSPAQTSAPATSTTEWRPTATYEPCAAVPDATLRALRIDPATRDNLGPGVVNYGGWNWCVWRSEPTNTWNGYRYYLEVVGMYQRFEQMRTNRYYTDFQDTTVNGRPALLHTQVDEEGTVCFVAFATGAESAAVSVSMATRGEMFPVPEDPPEGCYAKALRHAAAIEPHIPR